MPYTAEFLLSAEAAEMRAKRASGYPIPGIVAGNLERLSHVVWLETSSFQFQEFDAESELHALSVARNMVDNGWAMSASVRPVNPDGSLGNLVDIIGPEPSEEFWSEYEDAR